MLVVEDDDMLASALTRGLGAEGYAVDLARNGVDGSFMARELPYDIVILDILLPGLNGYRVCEEIREGGSTVPILMLTAKDGEWDQADGLDCGADDYLIKPFHFPVLLARIRALLRRGPIRASPVLRHGPLRLDPARHECFCLDSLVELTPREFSVLRYLLLHSREVVSKQELLAHVWGEYDGADHNVVQVYISSLRRKLDVREAPSLIDTVRGVGYRLRDVD